MKKGFTLIELMAVLIIISLITILTFPNIIKQIKKSKDINKVNIDSIVISAAKKYVNDNPNDYEEINNKSYCIAVRDLVDNDYLKEDIVNDKDNNLLDSFIIVNYTDTFNYQLIPYKKLDYIESTGKQYIDTKFIPTSKTKVIISLESDSFVLDANIFTATYNPEGFSMITNASQFIWHNGTINNLLVYNNDTNYTIEVYQNQVIINSEKILDMPYSKRNYSDSIKVFGYTNNTHMNKFKLFYMKIYEDDQIVRDYIPVLDRNGIPCLYDKLEDKLYYNELTENFKFSE